MRSALLCLGLIFSSASAASGSWVEHVVSGLYGPPYNTEKAWKGGAEPFGLHEAAVPGMPSGWDWSMGARTGRWNAVQPGEATGVNGVIGHVSGPLNYRVEARNMEVWMRIHGRWQRMFTTAGRDAESIYGSYFSTAAFRHAGGMKEEPGPDGGTSFPLRERHWSHFYCRGPQARVVIPEGFQNLHVRAQYRLVGAAASHAVVVGRAGADYFLSKDAKAPAQKVQPSVFIARHRFIGPKWQWYTATSMTPDEIRADPPPPPGDWREPAGPAPAEAASVAIP